MTTIRIAVTAPGEPDIEITMTDEQLAHHDSPKDSIDRTLNAAVDRVRRAYSIDPAADVPAVSRVQEAP